MSYTSLYLKKGVKCAKKCEIKGFLPIFEIRKNWREKISHFTKKYSKHLIMEYFFIIISVKKEDCFDCLLGGVLPWKTDKIYDDFEKWERYDG